MKSERRNSDADGDTSDAHKPAAGEIKITTTQRALFLQILESTLGLGAVSYNVPLITRKREMLFHRRQTITIQKVPARKSIAVRETGE